MLLALTLFWASVSCTKKMSTTDYGLNPKETFRIVVETEPPTLDWTKSSDTSSSFIVDNIMEGLVGFDYSGPVITVRPALASQWQSSNNAKSWEFTVRDDIFWTDGVKLTPQQVLDGWERLLNPATASVYAYFLFGLKNAQNYNSSKVTDFAKVGVKIEGQKILVELNEPSNLPYLLTHHSTFPIRKDIIAKFGDRWTEAANIVSLGSYKLKIWEHDRALVLERNETFFGELAKTKNVICYIIQEQTTSLNLFKGGQVDALKTLPSALLRVLKKMPEYQHGPILYTYYYGFNINKPPTDNLNLRKAIASAIDRKQITEMLQGGQSPLSGWVPKGMFGYNEKAGHTFDLTKALAYYQKAGYSLTNPAPKITLAFNTLDDHKRIAENIQSQLKKNLNLTVEINNEEWKVYLGTLQSNPPNVYRMGWVADYPDPYTFFELMTSTSDNNHTGWEDPSYDVLLRKSAETQDIPKKLELYAQIEAKLLVEATAVVPLYSGVNQHLISKRVKNFPHNAMSKYPLKDIEVISR